MKPCELNCQSKEMGFPCDRAGTCRIELEGREPKRARLLVIFLSRAIKIQNWVYDIQMTQIEAIVLKQPSRKKQTLEQYIQDHTC